MIHHSHSVHHVEPSAAEQSPVQPVKLTQPAGVHIAGLRVQFQGHWPVLDDLQIDIAPGEIIALIGASGCGKSTLLRAIAGLQEYQSGQIEFPREAKLETLADSCNDGSYSLNRSSSLGKLNQTPDRSFVFQDPTLLPWRTVYENVQLPFQLQSQRRLKLSRIETSTMIESALNSVALLPEQWRLYPRQLSGGMRMRTSIARALVTNPSLLLLDEPFAALDDILRMRLNQLVLDLWSVQKRTILFVTHNIAEAVMLSHRIAVVAGGKIAEVIDNQLPWPRDTQQRTSLAFAEQYSLASRALMQAANGEEPA